MNEIILKVSKLTTCYGNISAIKSIDFYAHDGEIVGIVGPNGAGKSTLLESIAGSVPIAEGQIEFMGYRVERWPVLKRRQLGIMLIPQEGNIFPLMSVKKNLDVSVILSERSKREELIDYVYELFPILSERNLHACPFPVFGARITTMPQIQLRVKTVSSHLKTQPRCASS